jgi:hypothetical protein
MYGLELLDSYCPVSYPTCFSSIKGSEGQLAIDTTTFAYDLCWLRLTPSSSGPKSVALAPVRA